MSPALQDDGAWVWAGDCLSSPKPKRYDTVIAEIRLYTHQTMIENQRVYGAIGYRETGPGTEAGYDRVFMRKRLGTSPTGGLDVLGLIGWAL